MVADSDAESQTLIIPNKGLTIETLLAIPDLRNQRFTDENFPTLDSVLKRVFREDENDETKDGEVHKAARQPGYIFSPLSDAELRKNVSTFLSNYFEETK